jgi:hypothetical protein
MERSPSILGHQGEVEKAMAEREHVEDDFSKATPPPPHLKESLERTPQQLDPTKPPFSRSLRCGFTDMSQASPAEGAECFTADGRFSD